MRSLIFKVMFLRLQSRQISTRLVISGLLVLPMALGLFFLLPELGLATGIVSYLLVASGCLIDITD